MFYMIWERTIRLTVTAQTAEPETQKSAARLPGISNRCDEIVDEIHGICASWSRLWDDCEKMEKDLRASMNLQVRWTREE